MKMITVGVFTPHDLPESFRVCIDGVVKHLCDFSVRAIQSDSPAVLAETDVIWDPRAGGGHPPAAVLAGIDRPLVVTLHGVAPMAIPYEYVRGGLVRRLLRYARLRQSNRAKVLSWKSPPANLFRIVTVSEFSKQSIVDCLGIDPCSIQVIHNGVDLSSFGLGVPPHPDYASLGPYFLHISNDEPRKNVNRIIAAYDRLEAPKWPLVIRISGNRVLKSPGVIQIRERVPDSMLSALYRGAGAFVFPSLYEGFGLPVIEAFASGCPVITSENSACAEVAGGGASLVNPRRTEEIRRAMMRAMNDYPGNVAGRVERALLFGWGRASEQYAAVFREAVAGAGEAHG